MLSNPAPGSKWQIVTADGARAVLIFSPPMRKGVWLWSVYDRDGVLAGSDWAASYAKVADEAKTRLSNLTPLRPLPPFRRLA